MPRYGNSDNVTFGVLQETTEGTFNTASAFLTQLTNGISPEFTSNMISDATVSGLGESLDSTTNLRGFNITTPATLRYSDTKVLVGAALRQAFPAEVTVVGSSNIDVLVAGTKLSGATGAQLKAPTGTFDTFINYDGASAGTHPRGGAEALMMKVSGSANSDNNRPRRIEAVWDDASFAYIDILEGYVGGSASSFGAPLTGTTLESITVRVGSAARNRVDETFLAYSMLWEFSDMTTNAKWQSGVGVVANDLTVSWDGKGPVTLNIPWVGHSNGELVAADPSGNGFTDAALLYGQMIDAANHLDYLALVSATTPTVLSSFNAIGFNATVTGAVKAIDNVSGTSTVSGVRRGKHKPGGTIDWLLADDPRVEALTAYGSAASNEKGGIDVGFTNALGQSIILGYLNNEFGPTGPVPGGEDSDVGGQIEFSGHLLTRTSRSFTWQEFST